MLLEWILLVGGLTSALLTIALALYRFWFSKPGEADYVFALLLVFHSGRLVIRDEKVEAFYSYSTVFAYKGCQSSYMIFFGFPSNLCERQALIMMIIITL